MIAVKREPLVIFLGLICVVLVGMVFGQFPPTYDDLNLAALLIALIEWIVYFLGCILANAEIGGGRALFIASLMLLTRFVLSALAGMMLTFPLNFSIDDATLRTWVGHPISVLLQMMAIMLITPHILHLGAPGLISEELGKSLETPSAPPPKPAEEIPGGQTAPIGGFIQVFSFEELQSIFRKSVGMEGFIIYTTEGLVFWKDMPFRMDVDALVARMQHLSDEMGIMVEGFGLTRARKVIVEAREHYLFNTRLSSNFGLVMIFSSSANVDDCWHRLAVMAKTTREFLQWKYPDLGSLRPITNMPSQTPQTV